MMLAILEQSPSPNHIEKVSDADINVTSKIQYKTKKEIDCKPSINNNKHNKIHTVLDSNAKD